MREIIKVSNEEGLVLTVTDSCEKFDPILGGDDSNPTWDEFVGGFIESFHPHLNLIKEALEKLGWIGYTGGDKANKTYFMFSDGSNIGFSWRAWGDLMQAIVNKKEGYMKYYM